MNERQKLYKQARRMRKANRSAQDLGDDDMDSHGVVRMRKKGNDSLDRYVERLTAGEEQRDDDTVGGSADRIHGRVVHLEAGRCQLIDDNDTIVTVELAEHLRLVQRSAIAVGDRVAFDGDRGLVTEVLPRRTRLSRPDPHNARLERLIVANVDHVVVVAAITSPPLRVNLIDRYLIAIERGGARPVICTNKIDLLEETDRNAKLAELNEHRELGIPVVACSAEQSWGVDELRSVLANSTSAFVGHSGVGKSSLLNALVPELSLDTGAVTSFAGKGRHTTTSSTLHRLDDGMEIIDTPGIRQFGLDPAGREELLTYFTEIEARSAQCRFGDCSHESEPACAVRTALDAGEISHRRYRLFIELSSELDR